MFYEFIAEALTIISVGVWIVPSLLYMLCWLHSKRSSRNVNDGHYNRWFHTFALTLVLGALPIFGLAFAWSLATGPDGTTSRSDVAIYATIVIVILAAIAWVAPRICGAIYDKRFQDVR